MKNVSEPLITGYYNLLNNIIVEGQKVTFHHLKAPYGTASPYILLTALYSHNKNTRDTFSGETTVDLEVFTSFDYDGGTMNLADRIAERVLELVIPQPGRTNVTAQGFTVAGALLIGMHDALNPEDNKNTFGKKLTIEHLIYQL